MKKFTLSCVHRTTGEPCVETVEAADERSAFNIVADNNLMVAKVLSCTSNQQHEQIPLLCHPALAAVIICSGFFIIIYNVGFAMICCGLVLICCGLFGSLRYVNYDFAKEYTQSTTNEAIVAYEKLQPHKIFYSYNEFHNSTRYQTDLFKFADNAANIHFVADGKEHAAVDSSFLSKVYLTIKYEWNSDRGFLENLGFNVDGIKFYAEDEGNQGVCENNRHVFSITVAQLRMIVQSVRPLIMMGYAYSAVYDVMSQSEKQKFSAVMRSIADTCPDCPSLPSLNEIDICYERI